MFDLFHDIAQAISDLVEHVVHSGGEILHVSNLHDLPDSESLGLPGEHCDTGLHQLHKGFEVGGHVPHSDPRFEGVSTSSPCEMGPVEGLESTRLDTETMTVYKKVGKCGIIQEKFKERWKKIPDVD